jgi:hypothetical protein
MLRKWIAVRGLITNKQINKQRERVWQSNVNWVHTLKGK